MKLNNLVRAAIFAALAIGVGFSLLLIPNIELITVTIFISGLTLGSSWGMLIGGTAEIIFSSLNPFGSGLSFPPLFFSQVLSMIIIGAIGGWLRPIFYRPEFSFKTLFGLGVTGLFVTFIYDSFTTLSYPISAGFELTQTLGIYISGLSFSLLHQISNAIVFTIGIPRVMKYLAAQS
jgi:hypothetical protein